MWLNLILIKKLYRKNYNGMEEDIMNMSMAIHTMVGAFVFPFFIRIAWGKMVEDFGAIGGWLAVTFVVALTWSMNHGVATPLIHQSGAWVDQGFAAGFGLLTATTALGGKFKKALPNMMAAIVGGALAALIVSFVFAP